MYGRLVANRTLLVRTRPQFLRPIPPYASLRYRPVTTPIPIPKSAPSPSPAPVSRIQWLWRSTAAAVERHTIDSAHPARSHLTVSVHTTGITYHSRLSSAGMNVALCTFFCAQRHIHTQSRRAPVPRAGLQPPSPRSGQRPRSGPSPAAATDWSRGRGPGSGRASRRRPPGLAPGTRRPGQPATEPAEPADRRDQSGVGHIDLVLLAGGLGPLDLVKHVPRVHRKPLSEGSA